MHEELCLRTYLAVISACRAGGTMMTDAISQRAYRNRYGEKAEEKIWGNQTFKRLVKEDLLKEIQEKTQQRGKQTENPEVKSETPQCKRLLYLDKV